MNLDDFMVSFMDKAVKWSQAQQEAEEAGKTEFVCPLCGGSAWWIRNQSNYHLHASCSDCGFVTAE